MDSPSLLNRSPARIVLCIALLICLGLLTWFLYNSPSSDKQPTTPLPIAAPAPQDAAATDARSGAPDGDSTAVQLDLPSAYRPDRIRVGIMCSQATGSARSGMAPTIGYGIQADIAGELIDPSVEPYWIIEPGSEYLDHMPEILTRFHMAGTLGPIQA